MNIKEFLTQEDGQMNKFVAISSVDKDHIAVHWKFPIAGITTIICPKDN